LFFFKYLTAVLSGILKLVLFDLDKERNFLNFNKNIVVVAIQDIEWSSQSDRLYSILSDEKIKLFDSRGEDG
jgi:hypothetical protein